MCWRSDASVLLCSGIMFVTIPTDGGSISDRYTRGVRLDTLNILGFAFQFAVLGIVPICAVRPERTFVVAAELVWSSCAAVLKRAVLSELESKAVSVRFQDDADAVSGWCLLESRWRAACS